MKSLITISTYFCWNTTEKKNLKSVFLAPVFGRPNRYTGLPNGLNTSLPSDICGRQSLKRVKWYGLFIQTRLSFTNFAWSLLEYFVSNNSLVCKFAAYIYFLLCYLYLSIDTHVHSAVGLFDMHDLVLVGRKSGSTLGQILSPHLHQQNLNQVILRWKQSVRKIKWIRLNFL